MNGKPWLPEHTDTLVKMNNDDWCDDVIAVATGHAKVTVSYRRRALGLTAGRLKEWNRKDRLRMDAAGVFDGEEK
jgi:hypothetical protein